MNQQKIANSRYFRPRIVSGVVAAKLNAEDVVLEEATESVQEAPVEVTSEEVADVEVSDVDTEEAPVEESDDVVEDESAE